MAPAPVFASVREALEAVRAGLAFVAAADAAELSTEEQAEALRGLERANSVAVAARTSVLAAFTAGKGYSADADYSVTGWLMHQTGITRGQRRCTRRGCGGRPGTRSCSRAWRARGCRSRTPR
jgi:hypothetical protein